MPKSARINQQIRAREVRVIDEAGGNLGVMSLSDALNIALERGLDLIEISPNTVPPVAKIMDFGKYQYLENKKQKQAKSKTHATETKNIQVKIGTGDHDLEIKAGKVSEFLAEGHRVKIDLFLPGRSKYLDSKFLQERLERLLKYITVAYRIADSVKKSPKGLSIIIEREK
ncbi:MAG: translation initiation factor IF-3 [Candidatus Vogelbacteria bacterium]|nr:translation initiation factor IF-3 [Candidatus Vogelbacteria bacterium]